MVDLPGLSSAVLRAGMSAEPRDAVFVAAYEVTADALRARGHLLEPDAAKAKVLRSVLLKPESEGWVDYLNGRLAELAKRARDW